MARTSLHLMVVAIVFSHTVLSQQPAAPICGGVASALAPCLGYLTNKEPPPSPNCCAGVKRLKDMGATKDDRQAICRCLKTQAAMLPNLNQTRAADLPKACNVKIDTPISSDIDCNKVP